MLMQASIDFECQNYRRKEREGIREKERRGKIFTVSHLSFFLYRITISLSQSTPPPFSVTLPSFVTTPPPPTPPPPCFPKLLFPSSAVSVSKEPA